MEAQIVILNRLRISPTNPGAVSSCNKGNNPLRGKASAGHSRSNSVAAVVTPC